MPLVYDCDVYWCILKPNKQSTLINTFTGLTSPIDVLWMAQESLKDRTDFPIPVFKSNKLWYLEYPDGKDRLEIHIKFKMY